MKSKKMKLWKIYMILSGLVILIVFLLVGLAKNFFVYHNINEKYLKLKNDIAVEKENKKKISEDKIYLKNSINVEDKVLDKYLLQKPGERVIEILK